MSYKEYHFLEPVAPFVVGIDIGRWYSGLALSHKSDRENILTLRAHGAGVQSREPSVLLLNPDNSFHSYGNEAVNAFKRIPAENIHRYFYYTSFNERNLVVKDFCQTARLLRCHNGNRLSARTVYGNAFRHLKDKAIALASATVDVKSETLVDDILWMISIPNDASDSFKLLIRDSASFAGIPKDRIRLVAESDCCLVYSLEHATFLMQQSPMKISQRAILVKTSTDDTEFSVHEKSSTRSYTVINRLAVDGLGGNRVNSEIEAFFTDIVEANKDGMSSNNIEHCQVMDTELMKLQVALNNQSMVKLDELLVNTLEKKIIFENAIASTSMDHLVEYNRVKNSIGIRRQLFEAFFLPWFRSLCTEIRKFMESFHDPHRTFAVICVGGPFERGFIREWLSAAFRRRSIVIPNEPACVVAMGAVMMGYLERGIEERICRFSYGIPVAIPFITGEHPESLKKIYDGEEWCENAFLKLIERGQVVRIGDTFILNIYSTAIDRKLKDNLVNMVLMKSKLRHPKYATHADGCSTIGTIGRKAPIGGWPKFWKGEIHLTIGEKDFCFRFINKTTNDLFAARVDFM